MGKSCAIEDTAALVQLAGEAARCSRDVPSQRRHLFEGLLPLVNGDLWVWAESKLSPGSGDSAVYRLDGGWRRDTEKAIMLQCVTHPWARQHIFCPLVSGSETHVTRLRSELVSDRRFTNSSLYRDLHSHLAYDDFILSTYRTDDSTVSALGIHRKRGGRRFTARERDIVHVLLGSVPWIYPNGRTTPGAQDVLHVSPRLQQILVLLLGGDGRKQIAAKLGLSAHTVDDYVKDLYRHFAVSSRSELAARFMSGRAMLEAAGSN